MTQALGRMQISELMNFIDESPTPFHVVASMKDILVKVYGFEVLPEDDVWGNSMSAALHPGGRFLVTRNGSSIAAIVMGEDSIEDSGFRIISAHTDSPNLRLKPVPVYDRSGYVQLGVEPYGGPILASWMNRDLGIAGRLIVRKGQGVMRSRLVKLPLTISIPNLAIHLHSRVNEDGLILNKQLHLPPIIGLPNSGEVSHVRLRNLLKEAGGISSEEEILGFDLALYDKQNSALGGFDDEFLYSSRLDNLLSCHAAMTALCEVNNPTPTATCIAVCYDNEEVGSQTAQGAQSSFLRDILERIYLSAPNLKTAIARSFAISADAAHALHPNYPEKHDSNQFPLLGGGPVLKTNANQRYATDGRGSAIISMLCEGAGIRHQNFVSRSDLACGSTIGPISAAELGVPTIDIGSPILSMHSIREVAGVSDHLKMIKLMTAFFNTHSVKMIEE